MAAQFNVDYCYEEGNEYKIETYDYQITVIDFDINWKTDQHNIFRIKNIS